MLFEIKCCLCIHCSIICLTCEFLAELSCDGGCFDQRRLANVFEILDFGHAVVVDKIVVFFGRGEGSVDPVTQVFDAHVLVVPRRHGLHQLCCVLHRSTEPREGSENTVISDGDEALGGEKTKHL